MSKIYGVSGYARVGKDTFADILQDLNPNLSRFSFAKKLKQLLQPLIWDTLGIDVFTSDDRQKKIIRPILVAYGEAARAIDENFWIKKILPEVEESLLRGKDVIITDVRYSNEASWVQSYSKHCLIGLMRHGVDAPNKEEMISVPKVFELCDKIIQWPDFSAQNGLSSVKELEELKAIVSTATKE